MAKSAKITDTVELIQFLKVADVIPTPDNPRRIHDNDPAVKSLAATLHGPASLVNPVIVRPHPDKPGKWDLRAGGRRLAAHKAAGLSEIKAIVRLMDDKTAREVTVIENMHREDLTPLDEARGIDILIADGKDVEAIAADLGKSVGFVYRRRQLSKLTNAWVIAFEDPQKDFQHWSAAHLELIARFDPEVQHRLLHQFSMDRAADWTLEDLNHRLADYLHVLKSAPWELNDEVLVRKAGACDACQKRSSCRPYLFDDMADKKASGQTDQCLDSKCWKAKDAAWIKRKETLLQEEYPELMKVAKDYFRGPGVLQGYEYNVADKKDKDAKPALVVSGTGRGELIWIHPRGEQAERKAEAGKPVPLKQLREGLNLQRLRTIAALVIEILEAGSVMPKFKTDLDLLLLVLNFMGSIDGPDGFQGLEKMRKKGRKGIVAAAAEAIRYAAVDILQADPDAMVVIKQTADLFGIDLKPLIAKAEQEHPEPPEWANLKADGTPKAASESKI